MRLPFLLGRINPSSRVAGGRDRITPAGAQSAWYTQDMASNLVDDAVRLLRELPEDVQAVVARAIIRYAESDDDMLFAR